jgi:hypothetical protein
MVTIVKHEPTGKKYVLIGTGYGAYKTGKPPVFVANRLPVEDSGTIKMASVSNEKGEIFWLPTDELIIVEINGMSPEQILTGS